MERNTLFNREFILNSYENSFNFYRKNLIEVKETFSEESIHDLRVSIRRFTAMFDILNEIFSLTYYPELRKIFKKQIKFLNPLRDSQVQILFLSKAVYQYPVLFTYYTKKLNDEQLLISRFKEFIETYSNVDTEGLFFFQKMQLKSILSTKEANIDSFADEARKSFQILNTNFLQLNIENLDSFHKVRLSVKKFRYIIEYLYNTINYPKNLLKNLKQIQTVLGEIQDSRVLEEEFRMFMYSDLTAHKSSIEQFEYEFLNLRQKKINEIFSLSANIPLIFDNSYFTLRDI